MFVRKQAFAAAAAIKFGATDFPSSEEFLNLMIGVMKNFRFLIISSKL